MSLEESSPGIHTDPSLDLGGMGAIIFDCDGVLVDVTESYDAAIDRTAAHVLKSAGISSIPITHGMIDGFKSTGGFNDEVDLAYAVIISLAAAAKAGKDKKEFMRDVIKNTGPGGIKSVERYVQKTADVSDVQEMTCHPGPERKSPLYHTFDQIFYGAELYCELFGVQSKFSGPGLIGRDRVILTESLLSRLGSRFALALVTGRGLRSARHTLGAMLDSFDLKSSAFLEDHPRELAKPNPQPLIDAVRGTGVTRCLYVGDSMEDLMMAQKVTGAIFCGITGTSRDPQAKLDLFRHAGARIVLDSVHEIPKALNLD